jgi:hypothetical protein
MGVGPSKTGVFVKFLNADGTPDMSKPTLQGVIAAVYGKTAPTGADGSPEWLTDLLISDDSGVLMNLKHSNTQPAYTSAASRKVNVQWQKKGATNPSTASQAVTIAVGYPMEPAPGHGTQPTFLAEGFLVLPDGVTFDRTHPLYYAWQYGSQYLLDFSQELGARSLEEHSHGDILSE